MFRIYINRPVIDFLMASFGVYLIRYHLLVDLLVGWIVFVYKVYDDRSLVDVTTHKSKEMCHIQITN